jgi:hypothetical protein
MRYITPVQLVKEVPSYLKPVVQFAVSTGLRMSNVTHCSHHPAEFGHPQPSRGVAHRGRLLGPVDQLLRIAGRIMSIADVAPPPCLAEPPLPGKCFV